MAAAGSFDGPIGIIAATIMARADHAEAEAVAELASGPGDDALVAGFGPAERHETPDPAPALLQRPVEPKAF